MQQKKTNGIKRGIPIIYQNKTEMPEKIGSTGVILETEGSVWKIQKRALFHYKKIKKGTPNLTSPYDHSLFTIVLIKQIFEKNRSSRAASGSRTQF